MEFKDGLSLEIDETTCREVKSDNPVVVFFEEKGEVKVVELDLAKFVGH